MDNDPCKPGTLASMGEHVVAPNDVMLFSDTQFSDGPRTNASLQHVAEFVPERLEDRLCLIASEEARDGSVRIHQDVDVFALRLRAGSGVEHVLGPDRHAWLQVARGTVRVGGDELEPGAGAAISGETRLLVEASEEAEVLLFDLA